MAVVILLNSAPIRAQSADAKPKATSTISGRVILNDKGAAGISVAAFGNDMPNRQAVARAVTDSEGRYRLTGLPAGQYQITTLAPSFATADQAANPNSYYGPGKSIVLSARENVDDVDIKLVRGSVITGRVTDADGGPVVEQRVELQALDQNGNPGRQPQLYFGNYEMNQTDDRGVYRIYGLPAGRYRVSVGTNRDAGFISSNNHTFYPQTFYPDVTDAAKATVIELNEGSEAANIDIRVGRGANTYVATGRVVDSDTGQPITGVRIMYGPAQPNQQFNGGFIGLPTNARGDFRLEGLEPGRYGVSISASFDSSNVYSDTVFFEVSDADVSNLEIKATHGLTVSGVVMLEGAGSNLMTNLAMLRIFATVASASNAQSRTSASSTIATDGSFQMNGLRPGRINVNVYAVSNPTLRGVTTRIERGGVDVTQNLELQAGESITDLRVFLIIGTGTIRGTVKFEGGAVPSNARSFIGVRREGTTNSGNGALVDARGHFLLSNLAAGTYEVTLNMNFIQPPGRPIPPQKQLVNVTDDAEVEVTFTVDLKPRESGP